MKKLPVGTQSFEVLRNDGAIYVDKTQDIYNLISNGRIYFLSRPRRFGKSLLISTFKELFKGRKELFEGLYIYDKWEWSKKYAVIHLDFAELGYDTREKLEGSLFDFVKTTARQNNIELQNSQLETMFSELIEKIHERTGQQVVILIDEYDKPLIDNLVNKEVYNEVKRSLHNFYQVIKGGDEHIKFVFMTGVSRFAGLSVFSALNNLNDITMNNKYVCICGYTQEELESNFRQHIEEVAKINNKTTKEILLKIKHWYNGYSWDGKAYVYNPFSTLMFFDNKKFKGYWFNTGTPTFLIEQIKKKDNIELFVQKQAVMEEVLSGFAAEEVETTALLFQTGYLTVKKEEETQRGSLYSLDFANFEVKDAFLTSLIKVYTDKTIQAVYNLNDKLYGAIIGKDEEKLKDSLIELYASIPYDLQITKEAYYHSLFLLTCRLAGFEVEGEVHTNKGRIDVVLNKGNSVIIVEIKYSKDNKPEEMLNEAILQIRNNKYYEKYTKNNPTLLAIVFSQNKEIACKFENI